MNAAKKGFHSDAQDFIAAAGQRPASAVEAAPAKKTRAKAAPAAPAGDYPWKTADERIPKQFGLRMKEPLHAKLTWLGENVPGVSMHSFCLEAVEAAVEAKLKELGIA